MLGSGCHPFILSVPSFHRCLRCIAPGAVCGHKKLAFIARQILADIENFPIEQIGRCADNFKRPGRIYALLEPGYAFIIRPSPFVAGLDNVPEVVYRAPKP